MKTPDEIKKWLECCTHGTCNSCPYFGDECDSDREVIDTLEYIQQLERKIGEFTGKVAQLEAAQPKWISVEELPPELPCICYDGVNMPHEVGRMFYLSTEECTRYYDHDPFEFIEMLRQTGDFDEPFDIGSMTHILFWMPLPEPPKEEA